MLSGTPVPPNPRVGKKNREEELEFALWNCCGLSKERLLYVKEEAIVVVLDVLPTLTPSLQLGYVLCCHTGQQTVSWHMDHQQNMVAV